MDYKQWGILATMERSTSSAARAADCGRAGRAADHRETGAAVKPRPAAAALLAGLLALGAGTAQAELRLGLIDTFDDISAEGWSNRGGIVRTVTSGGASGGYLRVTSTGPQAVPRCDDPRTSVEDDCGSRLEMDNLGRNSDWLGDYLGLGVRSVELSARNFGDEPAPLRLAFSKIGVSSTWWITSAHVLPAHSGWETVRFSLLEQDMSRTRAFELDGRNYSDAFANVNVARLLVNAEASNRGEKKVYDIGVDEIALLATVTEGTGGGTGSGGAVIFTGNFEN